MEQNATSNLIVCIFSLLKVHHQAKKEEEEEEEAW
jgi:hypothetical protein